MKKLWNDECGAIISAELILVMTILGLGMIVGLKTLQVAINTELGDVAAAVGNVNQSYFYNGLTACDNLASVDGSSFVDETDSCTEANAGGITLTEDIGPEA